MPRRPPSGSGSRRSSAPSGCGVRVVVFLVFAAFILARQPVSSLLSSSRSQQSSTVTDFDASASTTPAGPVAAPAVQAFTLADSGRSGFTPVVVGASPAVLALSSRERADTDPVIVDVRLIGLGPGSGPRWVSGPYEYSGQPRVTQAGATAYLDLGREVVALELADGSVRWRREVIGGGVVVDVGADDLISTSSTTLQSLRAADGSVRWSLPLGSSEHVLVAGERLATSEAVDGKLQVTPVDRATGQEGRTAIVSCGGRGVGRGHAGWAVPGTNDVVVLPADGVGCAARVDLAAGSVRWSVPAPPGEWTLDDEQFLVGDGRHLALQLRRGLITVLDLGTGAERRIEPPPGQRYGVAALLSGTLVVDVVGESGTDGGGVAGLDPASGRVVWTRPLPVGVVGASRALVTQFGVQPQATSALVAGPDRLRRYWVENVAGLPAVRGETIDPRTGAVSEATTTTMGAVASIAPFFPMGTTSGILTVRWGDAIVAFPSSRSGIPAGHLPPS